MWELVIPLRRYDSLQQNNAAENRFSAALFIDRRGAFWEVFCLASRIFFKSVFRVLFDSCNASPFKYCSAWLTSWSYSSFGIDGSGHFFVGFYFVPFIYDTQAHHIVTGTPYRMEVPVTIFITFCFPTLQGHFLPGRTFPGTLPYSHHAG